MHLSLYRFLKIFSSETAWPNETKLDKKHLWKILPSFGSFDQTVSEEKNLKIQPIRNKNRLWRPCLLMDRDEKECSFSPDPLTNMATTGNSCF
jgi:hypothetical protein